MTSSFVQSGRESAYQFTLFGSVRSWLMPYSPTCQIPMNQIHSKPLSFQD